MLKILKTFYRFLFGKPLIMVFFFFFVIVSQIAGAVQPYFYKLFIDAIPGGNFSVLLRILIFYIAIKFAAMIFSLTGRTFGDRAMLHAVPAIDLKVFKRLQDLDFAFHTNKSSGALINRMKRGQGALWDLHEVVNYKTTNFLVNAAVLFFFFKDLDIRVVGLALASMVLSFVAAAFAIPKNIEARRGMNRVSDKVTGVIVDNLANYDTVKMFAKELWEMSRLKRMYRSWQKFLWKYAISFRYIGGSTWAIANISLFVILLLIISQRGISLSAGEFILVVGFLHQLDSASSQLIWNVRGLAKNFTDITKYFEILDEEIKVKDPQDPAKIKQVDGEIEYKKVSFAYEEGREKTEAIKDINLKIRQGQSLAFVGRSGAGKTTMVKLLMRFFDVDEGEITIDGVNVKDFTKSDLRSFMGVVPQEPILFNNTIGYNIAYGKERATQREMIAAAKLANIHDFIAGLPKGYQTKVGERGIKLSGGQKQRVAIARMILSDPEIVIFDEATSQLDSESERLIQDAFWKATEDKTTIIIAHRLSTVMRADKIVVMEEGRIVETGSHNELLAKKSSLYKHFWELQTLD